MTAAEAQSRQQAKLWSLAFAISALANGVVLLSVAAWVSFRVLIAAIELAVLAALGFDPANFVAKPAPPPAPHAEETVATIVPEMVEVLPPKPKPPEAAPFARTSSDQEAPKPENPSFIGDRNTRAASDAPAVAQAPMLPSQKGREPHTEDEIETTVSKYQDGDLASDRIAAPREAPAPDSAPSAERMSDSTLPPSPPTPLADPAMASKPAEPTPSGDPSLADQTTAPPPAPEPVVKETAPPEPSPNKPAPPVPEVPKDKLAQSSMPVERQVKEETPPEPPKPPQPARRSASTETTPRETPPPRPQQPPSPPKSAAPKDAPGFRGNQQKTRLSGSISRQGRSALDVEDSLLGRYHASLSRAVEKEWQLNCVRNRDYITPGQIIVRFVLEPSGKVRSLTFVEEFGVGNIQKGFTSESIRTAAIPPFPDELKKQLNNEPLEITYSFTF